MKRRSGPRMGVRVWAAGAGLLGLTVLLTALAQGAPGAAPPARAPLRGEHLSRSTFPNPHAHIPAQCYVETSSGTQNACATCHTDGVARLKLGNNNPQAGDNPNVGNLQAAYAFGVYDYPQVQNSSVNPWENTLRPEALRRVVEHLGLKPESWDMEAYVREDNWRAAYAQRPGQAQDWDPGVNGPFRLFPGLAPDDLPAQDDGFVRSTDPARGVFQDARGWVTGWRAVNFMPHGIFTPLAGSVSGVYMRLPARFMQDAAGRFDLGTYRANLDLVARSVQDRLRGERTYLGAASGVAVVRGQYPLGTEFAHPLHYVDVGADGTDLRVSPFPGTRARRVKEVRWMYKQREWYPEEFGLALKDESAPVYASRTQGWIENGAGWLLGGWIEDQGGRLRPQTPSELTQCVACHSGNVRQSEVGQNATFTSGTGNTVDSTWALPRQLGQGRGWREMDYLGYRAAPGATGDAVPGSLSTPEPRNRGLGVGEFRAFLDRVVGASLYGDMPDSVERFLAVQITRARGYSADWPELRRVIADQDVRGIQAAQRRRLALMREFTAKGAYLTPPGAVRPELFLPTRQGALAAAARYRQVVVTQRYDFGKDVFPETPFTLRYFRTPETAYPHQDGRPYASGEVITDRPVDRTPANFTFGIGEVSTLIDESLPFERGGTFLRDYVPLLEE
ncbi:hypothetical protein SAMN04488058_1277 [Deinococcus reticulitermitis]|uniref:Cytochrome c domain-containing protein n=1 Tax=Deinococcus reticulitermitis TaxID=856736 RepID=A0A1H7CG20_9DEIO|nr:hypothetical protein [Deinococcus reticulitermitis]SEJ87547.1 hypothetical protein SAMN04488058_1277 [Deinococcus reticulitermitis]